MAPSARTGTAAHVRYVHVVFTLPHELAPLALQNKKAGLQLTVPASAETLLEIARDPTPSRRRDRLLQRAPHLEPALAASSAYPLRAWPPAVSLRTTPAGSPPGVPSSCPSACSAVSSAASSSPDFAAPSIAQLQFHGELLPLAQPRAFAAWLRVLFRHDWVVYSKRPFGGPEHVLRYLGAYTHRVAISNTRLVALSEGDVTFRWRDSAHGNKKRLMTLAVDEFLRRFLLHLLPRGFVRIRNFGFLANRQRALLLPLCLQLLRGSDEPAPASPLTATLGQPHSLWNCPLCGGTMRVVERLSAAQLLLRSPPQPEPVRSMNLYPHPRHCSCFGAHTEISCLALGLGMRYGACAQTPDVPPHVLTATTHLQSGRSYPTAPSSHDLHPAQPHSKYIAFHRGGFLQVAVSEAPLQSVSNANCSLGGAPDTALRLIRTKPFRGRSLTQPGTKMCLM